MSQGNNNVVRASRNKNYKTIGCDFLDDKKLTYKAKGILTYLLTRPDNWRFNKSQVMGMSEGGESSFDSGIKELKERGYLRIEKSSDGEGKFLYEWYPQETATFYAEPIPQEELDKLPPAVKNTLVLQITPEGDFPGTDNPVPEKPSPDNHPLYHIGSNNKDKTTRSKQRVSASKAPPLPTTIAETMAVGHEFPYESSPVNVSAIWYWATERFKKYKIDFFITGDSFKKMLFKYKQNIPKIIGDGFDAQKKYIDWFMDSKDKFIIDKTSWGFDYLVATHCINKYYAEKGKEPEDLILTEEDRRKVSGKWLKN